MVKSRTKKLAFLAGAGLLGAGVATGGAVPIALVPLYEGGVITGAVLVGASGGKYIREKTAKIAEKLKGVI